MTKTYFNFKKCKLSTTDHFRFFLMAQMKLPILPFKVMWLLSSLRKITLKEQRTILCFEIMICNTKCRFMSPVSPIFFFFIFLFFCRWAAWRRSYRGPPPGNFTVLMSKHLNSSSIASYVQLSWDSFSNISYCINCE